MTACASILCDACSRPGRCCTGFELKFIQAETALEALIQLATTTNYWHEGRSRGGDTTPSGADHIWLGLPYLPLYQNAQQGWRFWCPLLGRDGRCSVYATRPPICRSYEAGSDRLCAMHTPAPSLDGVDFDAFAGVSG